LSQPKSELDWKIFYARSLPGPGQYEVARAPPTSGAFSTAVPKSSLDWAIDNARKLPGPGRKEVIERERERERERMEMCVRERAHWKDTLRF
jgi:hypothetical protein